MLTTLYIMQVYWFAFIVALIVRVMLGGKVEDIREDTEEEKVDKKEDSDDKHPPATGGGKESGGAKKASADTPKTRKRKNKAGTN